MPTTMMGLLESLCWGLRHALTILISIFFAVFETLKIFWVSRDTLPLETIKDIAKYHHKVDTQKSINIVYWKKGFLTLKKPAD